MVLEHDPETGHFTGTVPGIPAIVVDAKTEKTALKRARDAIVWFLEEAATTKRARRGRASKPVRAKIATVQV